MTSEARNEANLRRLVRQRLPLLAHACWLASEWQRTSADAEFDVCPEKWRNLMSDARRLRSLEKTLKRYMANESMKRGG